jgi:hypothetical protein
VRAVRLAQTRWRIGTREPGLRVQVGDDGEIADALQGLTGARFGNGRLAVGAGPGFCLEFGVERLRFTPAGALPDDALLVLAEPVEALLRVEVEPAQG